MTFEYVEYPRLFAPFDLKTNFRGRRPDFRRDFGPPQKRSRPDYGRDRGGYRKKLIRFII